MPYRSRLRAVRTGGALIVLLTSVLTIPIKQFAQQPATQPKQPPLQSPPTQTAGPEQESAVRISTQLVQIDAVVIDKKGEHVEDLTEDDFEISVDGKRQSLWTSV